MADYIRKTFQIASQYLENSPGGIFSEMLHHVAMSYDVGKLRSALQTFMAENKLKEYPLELAAKIGQGTIRAFRTGRTNSMTDETWTRLAAAASEKLGRNVLPQELRGELRNRVVPISSRVGAGEMVYPVEVDSAIGWVEPPPEVDASEAYQVEGDSMRPLYGPRDILFPSRHRREPARLIGRIVVAQVADEGPRVVKQLMRGSRKGRWNLVSVNPAHSTLEDRKLDWVALIAAAIYADA